MDPDPRAVIRRLLATLDAAQPDTRLRTAAQALYDEASETFPDEWIDDESSMAMQVTVHGRTLATLRAALGPLE